MPTRTDLGWALCDARERTDELFRLVHPDALYERPIPERHRIVFYLGHMEAFDWNLIARALNIHSFSPSFDKLFAFGIDPPAGQLPSDRPSDWPSVAAVERYSQRTRDEIDGALEAIPEQLLHVAIEHRLMHAETFAYILHQLPYVRKTCLVPETPCQKAEPSPCMIEIPAGRAHLGRDPHEGFGWDNEFHACDVNVPAFAIGKYKVTNREYLDFVREGADPPPFWIERDGRWFCRAMFSEIPLPFDWPVYATQRQAEAFAKWRGMRLPSEAEYHRAAALSPDCANADFRRWDPTPVNSDDEPDVGPSQMRGNGWEWTSTVFGPFPGFKPFPFYPNYSEPFFDGQHYVLKGASPRTAARFLRPSFRNWFRASYPYIYSTFRLAES